MCLEMVGVWLPEVMAILVGKSDYTTLFFCQSDSVEVWTILCSKFGSWKLHLSQAAAHLATIATCLSFTKMKTRHLGWPDSIAGLPKRSATTHPPKHLTKKHLEAIYPLVNVYITMEKYIIVIGKTHCKWFFIQWLSEITRGYQPTSLSFHDFPVIHQP